MKVNGSSKLNLLVIQLCVKILKPKSCKLQIYAYTLMTNIHRVIQKSKSLPRNTEYLV